MLVSGVAGLLAGAFSMAAGEYVSVRSQREMFEHQIAAERDELAEYPEQEAAELSLIYQARGLTKDDADKTASHLIANPSRPWTRWRARSWASTPPRSARPRRGRVIVRLVRGRRGGAAGAVRVRRRAARRSAPRSALTAAALFGVGCAISLFTGRGALAQRSADAGRRRGRPARSPI